MFARKTSDLPTRIYSYRCLPPVSEQENVERQFRLGHQYRNARVEIERRLIDRLRDVVLACPGTRLTQLQYEEACAGVDDAINEVRLSKTGSGSPTQDHLDHLEGLKDLRAEASADLRAAKAEHNDVLVVGYEHARKAADAERLTVRHDYIAQGLRHGTYDRIENSVRQAFKDAQAHARSRGLPVRWPGFERYDGSGSIGQQIVGGMTVAELIGGADTRVRLGAPGEADAHPRNEVIGAGNWSTAMQLPRNVRRHAARTFAWLRIASNVKKPVFAKFPITFHRDLPSDAVIKWAYVVRRRIGHQLEWRLQLTIESAAFYAPAQPTGASACAIDLGWRRIFEDGKIIGLRAGYVVDEHGLEREIRVPAKLLTGMDKVTDLASIRDREFDGARAKLVAWIADRTLPDWLTKWTEFLAQWRAPRKLQALIDHWHEDRFEGDAEIVGVIEAWAKQDRHLQSWQEHQRGRLIAHRLETWRVIATDLARTYATIVIEDGTNRAKDQPRSMRLADVPGWEQPAPEDGDPSDGREQRRMSRLAAPGELRAEIAKAAYKTGAKVIEATTASSTRACAWCAHEQQHVDFAASVTYRCEGCNRMADQDANAGRNLLQCYGFTSGPLPPTPAEVPATTKPSRSRRDHGAGSAATPPAAKIR